MRKRENGRGRARAKTGVSMNRLILRMVVTMGATLILLLALLDIYMIRRYQESLRTGWKTAAVQIARGVREDLSAIRSDLYDIRYYDPNYALLRTAGGTESLAGAHELEERLKTLTLLKQRAAGYVFYFDDMQKKRYYFLMEDLTHEDVESVKAVTEELARGRESARNWHYVTASDKDYAVCTVRDGEIALFEVYCLEPARESLARELEGFHADVFFARDLEVMGPEAVRERYGDLSDTSDKVERGVYQYRTPVSGTDLYLVLAVPMRPGIYLNASQLAVLFLAFVVIILTVLACLRLRSELFRPIDRLTAEMRRIGGGDWSRGISTHSGFLEIQQVIETTDVMIEEIEKQKLLAYEKTIQEQQARMQYLSLQLNPHFYLNGLKTLNALAMNGENRRIQDIIIGLSAYLRYLLQMEKEMVPLGGEIDFVNNYADLCRETTDRPLRLEWRIDREEEVRRLLVPKLCIQTFVENSFKYARLGDQEGGLVIGISVNRLTLEDRELLEIEVRDNGNGYREDLLELLNNEPEQGSASVGINNLKRRCEILYEGGLDFAFYNDNGAVSDVFYPLRSERG